MPRCSSCDSEVAQATPFCANCGKPLAAAGSQAGTLASDDPTLEAPPPAAACPRPPSSRRSSLESRSAGRFAPGILVAGRYQIVALLGRGGMGEVYRADDLSLGQSVALKFLPAAVNDEGTLERFRNEVRIARRISHPNVCRVYDIGQAEGLTFFSMEYVDGEDLASLRRRIGRLPGDKALEMARKICAGLAAAHDKGVLHRDLKPANIMLDGRGEVLIMDFGLAGIAHEIEDIRSGTPAYMAPEQLAGEEVTTRSDIYALGLVLYEVFTGKAVFDGKTPEEVVRVRRDSTPSKPSTVVRDLDPAVERVILHCLEAEPENRPPSALAVAAALPGGDPLAAALAAGETPSPQVVAAAGGKAGLKPRVALGSLAIALAGLVTFYVLSAVTTVMSRMDLPYSTEVLTQKARDMVRQLGYSNPPTDSASNYSYDGDFLEYLDHEGSEHPNWTVILKNRPTILTYWYRQSPDYLIATEYKTNLLVPGDVDLDDPPPILSGMAEVSLDPQGRLVHLQAIPPQMERAAAPSKPYDWAQLFTLAGLDISQFQSAEPIWNSLGASDARAAWAGVWPGTSRALRVEAATWRGKPIFFQLAGDWTKPGRMPEDEHGTHKKLLEILLVLFLMILLAGAGFLARHNYRQQRSDTQGALRLAATILILQIATWLCVGHFVPSVGLFGLFVLATSGALFLAAVFCVVYVAIEPYVRRHWPHAIISWSRLMAGRIRDPLVARDVLYGVILGITWSVIYAISHLADQRIGAAPDLPSTQFLLGARQVLGACLLHLTGSIQATLAFFFLMFVFRVALRKPWLAGLVFIAFWTSIRVYGAHHFWIEIPVQIAVYAVAAIVVLRFGFIALAVGILVANLLLIVPITTSLSAWYAGGSIFVVLLVAAMAVWGAYTALAGQKLWQHQLFE